MSVITQEIEQWHDDLCCRGFVAYPRDAKIAPAIMVVHDWSGLNQRAKERAFELAQMGYVAYAVDMYGLGKVGESNQEKEALMMSILPHRSKLRERLNLFLDKLRSLPQVDHNNIFAIGFCFGGLCVLDLARSGAHLKGVVSFHGLLSAAPECLEKHVHPEVLVLHAFEDPMVKPADLLAFCDEMTSLGAKWEVDIYAQTKHAFTNPDAHDVQHGLVYNEDVAQRAFTAMHAFFARLIK